MANQDRIVPTSESAAALGELAAVGRPITVSRRDGTHDLRHSPDVMPDLLAWLGSVR